MIIGVAAGLWLMLAAVSPMLAYHDPPPIPWTFCYPPYCISPMAYEVVPAATPEPTATRARATATRAPEPTSTRVPAPKRIECLPKHAARPIALCETGSGSGWWLNFVINTGVVTGPHVARIGTAGDAELFYSPSGQRVRVTWIGGAVVVSTTYRDGKPYRFYIEGGEVVWLQR